MIKKAIEFLFNYKFALLLFTLVGQIFIPVFFIDFVMHGMMSYLFMSLTMIVSILIFKNLKRHNLLRIFSAAVMFIMLLTWIEYFSNSIQIVHLFRLVLVSSLYITIFVNIFKEFKNRQDITLDFIFGAISGYLILGLIGSFMSVFIDFFYPNSFAFVSSAADFQDHIYFNFVTLTTLGYGDVLPITEQGQMHAVLVAIVGQLYLTITIAMIVGRYLMSVGQKKD